MRFVNRLANCTLIVLCTVVVQAVMLFVMLFLQPADVCLEQWTAAEWNALAAVLQLPPACLQIFMLIRSNTLSAEQFKKLAEAERGEERQARVRQALEFADDPNLREAAETINRVFAAENVVTALQIRDALLNDPQLRPALEYLFDRLDRLARRIFQCNMCPKTAFDEMGEFAVTYGRRFQWYLKAERTGKPRKYRWLIRLYRNWIPRLRS